MNQKKLRKEIIFGIVCGLLLLILPAADAANTTLYNYTFQSDNQSWVSAGTCSSSSNCDLTRGWNSTDGIPPGSLYFNQSQPSNSNIRTTESSWSSPNLSWSNGTPTSAKLNFSYKVMVEGSTSSVTISAYIIKTDNTGVLVYQGSAITSNTGWVNISVPVGTNNFTTAGNYKIRLNGTLLTSKSLATAAVRWDTVNLTLIWETPQTYIPPKPSELTPYQIQNSFWVNYTWQAGAVGNITNSYNVSHNGSWSNNTIRFRNNTVGPHNWSNITVYAYNSSGTGQLSETPAFNNTQVANNVPVLYSIGPKTVTAGNLLTFTVSATDVDLDTIIYGTNATNGTLNSTTGLFSWMPGSVDADKTYIWLFNSSDGWGGTVNETITVDVADVTRTYINGTVRSGGNAVEGVTVSTPSNSTTTDASGFYSLVVAAGTYALTAELEPVYYTNSSVTADVVSGVVVQDIELLIKPTGTITGSVTNV